MIARPSIPIHVDDQPPAIPIIVNGRIGIFGFFAPAFAFLTIVANGVCEFTRGLLGLGTPDDTGVGIVGVFGSVIGMILAGIIVDVMHVVVLIVVMIFVVMVVIMVIIIIAMVSVVLVLIMGLILVVMLMV